MQSPKVRAIAFILALGWTAALTYGADPHPRAEQDPDFSVPRTWEYTAPLIAPEVREHEPSRAQ